MLGLKLPSDPRWVTVVEKDIPEILTDHAYCEQKAASTAISLMVSYPEKSELVAAMTALAREELSHFKMVHDIILKRGLTLGKERSDKYVTQLMTFFPKGGLSREEHLVHRLLYAALIEARSCERFRILSENISDNELSDFYKNLMASEASHYTLFLNFARKYGRSRNEVDSKWQALLDFEAEIIKELGTEGKIHG